MTGRDVPEWIGKTPSTIPPDRVRIRVFERAGGVCHITKRKILTGEAWDCDHVLAIINGGENRESNLAPVLKQAHREKTKADVALKAKIARVRQKHLGIKKKSRNPIRGWKKMNGTPVRSDQ